MITVLITGQVRDRAVFLRLMEAINETREHYDSVIYSTWTDELSRLPHVLDGACLPNGVQFVDAGSPFFAPTITNRDVSSFIAQHLQLVSGLEMVDPKSYVIRLRADYDCQSVANYTRMIRLILDIWRSHEYSDCALVSGADEASPYFFEDRILLLPPRHTQRLSRLRLDDAYKSDYFNIFPEYQIYSSIMGAKLSPFFFHDHRYRMRAGLGGLFSDYDFQSFGRDYPNQVRRYLAEVATELSFLSDAANVLGRSDDYDHLASVGSVPRNFRIDNMREYYRVWLDRAEKYEEQVPSDVLISQDIITQKRALNGIYLQYFSGNTSVVADTPVMEGVFASAAAEFVAVSRLLVGGGASELQNLMDLYVSGARGFELCFYLLRGLAEEARESEFEQVASGALDAFKHVARMSDHVEHQRVVLKRAQKGGRRRAVKRAASVDAQ